VSVETRIALATRGYRGSGTGGGVVTSVQLFAGEVEVLDDIEIELPEELTAELDEELTVEVEPDITVEVS